MDVIVRRRDKMVYKAKAYRVKDVMTTKKEYVGNVYVEKGILGNPKDIISGFEYSRGVEDKDGIITGANQERIEKAEEDIVIFKDDFMKENKATEAEIAQYQDEFPLTKVSEIQEEIKFALTTTLGDTKSSTK